MTEAKLTWSIWQALLKTFAWAFTCRGFHRFAEWITAMALNVEEHTITQSVLALEQPAAWKALESFAEYGSWHQDRVTWGLTRLIATAPGRIWHGYHVSAVDDTKVHRSSPHVWGTCTFHEYTARCPNRAATVRAHNWVVLGALLPEPEKPAWFLPISGRLYFRKSQLPVGPEGILEFHTKCELAVALLREQARIIKGKHLAVFDGGYALESVVRPLVLPEGGAPRIEFLTRLRCNARLYALPLPPEQYPEGKPGPKPKWGKRLEPPRRGGMWNAKWQVGTAFVYGRQREIRWKEIICLWRVLGWEVPVKAIVASVEGYKQRFTLVTSAVELTGLQIRLSSLCSFRTLYFTPESGPATEGFSCRGAVMNDEGNAARKIRKLRASRDLWKRRSAEKQQEIRQLRVTVRDLSSSRENWKTRVKELEQQLQAAHEAHAAVGPGSWIFFGGLMDNQAMPRTRRTPITLSSD